MLTIEGLTGLVLILSSIGVIGCRKPVHSCLFFLLALLSLAALYIELSTEFIGLVQILVYGGAILVLFMFVMILFQDAHEKIDLIPSMSSSVLLGMGGISVFIAFGYLAKAFFGIDNERLTLTPGYGSVESIGRLLYINYFFPFEVAVLLILVALIGALYIGKKAS